jgi:hypothetical protein
MSRKDEWKHTLTTPVGELDFIFTSEIQARVLLPGKISEYWLNYEGKKFTVVGNLTTMAWMEGRNFLTEPWGWEPLFHIRELTTRYEDVRGCRTEVNRDRSVSPETTKYFKECILETFHDYMTPIVRMEVKKFFLKLSLASKEQQLISLVRQSSHKSEEIDKVQADISKIDKDIAHLLANRTKEIILSLPGVTVNE